MLDSTTTTDDRIARMEQFVDLIVPAIDDLRFDPANASRAALAARTGMSIEELQEVFLWDALVGTSGDINDRWDTCLQEALDANRFVVDDDNDVPVLNR